MSRNTLESLVFLAGLAAVAWIGAGYAGSNPLALAFTLLIGVCYVAGALELRRYRQATAALDQAVAGLSAPPPDLDGWLEHLPAALRHPVRLRVEGERVALPGPALTPYLVGLLVLLGMLGTLLGMMATLRGTGLALESATDLQAIRTSLAAPVKGLGFAFGTSIAGVAASAMLGLLSALCRRQRAQAVQRLDAATARHLRLHTRAHRGEETQRLLQRQTELMPVLVDRLQAMMATIERQNQAAHAQQLAGQQAFHDKAESTYAQLAASVAQSLQDSVAEGARAAGAVLQPAVETTLAALSRETAALHDGVNQAVQRQLQGLAGGFETHTAKVAELWHQALAEQQRANGTFASDLRQTLDGFAETFDQRSAGLIETVGNRLDAGAATLATRWDQALARQDEAHQALASRNQQALEAATATFEQHAASLLAELGRSHTELQAELRQKLSDSMVRDTAMLEERTRMMATLETLLTAVNHASTEQRTAIDALVATSADLLDRAGTRFIEHVQAETGKLDTANAQAAASAAEVASLGEAFGAAVRSFGESSEALATRLQGIEHALERSLARSDEQLAYYVAQAREVVDLSVLAQRQILEELRQGLEPHTPAEAEAGTA